MLRLLPLAFLMALAGALAGCTSSTGKSDVELALLKLKGQHIEELINRIGLPDDQMDIAGSKVYTWGHTLRCVIKVRVDAADTIDVWQVEGYQSSCEDFATRL